MIIMLKTDKVKDIYMYYTKIRNYFMGSKILFYINSILIGWYIHKYIFCFAVFVAKSASNFGPMILPVLLLKSDGQFHLVAHCFLSFNLVMAGTTVCW